MEKKKKSKASIVVVILIILIVIAVGAYMFLTNKENETNSEETTITEVSKSEEEVSEELDYDSEEVQAILEKMSFLDEKRKVLADIYNVGDFDLSSIDNELILQLGFANVSDEDKMIKEETELSSDIVSGTVIETIIITQEIMEKSIQEIFGENIEYTDESFDPVIETSISYYDEQIADDEGNLYIINYDEAKYSNGQYEITVSLGEGGDGFGDIYQYMQSAVKTNNQIDIYVKTAEISSGNLHSVVSSTPFITDMDESEEEIKADNKVAQDIEYTSYDEDFDELYKFFYNINDFEDILNISDKLNTYVYTFELDEETGEYYLRGFRKEETNTPNINDYIYDAEFTYTGTETSYTTEFDETYTIDDIKLPYINLDSQDATIVNEEIKDMYMELSEEFEEESIGEKVSYFMSDYLAYINDNILSVVITVTKGGTDVPRDEYYTYNFDLETLNLITYEDIYASIEISKDNIDSLIKESISDYFDTVDYEFNNDLETKEEYIDKSFQNYQNSVEDSSIRYFLDDYGYLNVVVETEEPVGNGSFNRIIKVY